MRRAKVVANDSAPSNYLRERKLWKLIGERIARLSAKFDTSFDKCREVRHFFGTLLVLNYITSGVLVNLASVFFSQTRVQAD
jgi:hypothetical protein